MSFGHSREQLVDSRFTNQPLGQTPEASKLVNEGTQLVVNDIAGPSPVCFENASALHKHVYKNKVTTTKDGQKRRLVNKSGELKVLAKNVPGKTRLYLADLFTTLIDLRWKWVILIFVSSYVFSWTLFGFIWWFIAWLRGSSTCVYKVCQRFSEYFCFGMHPFYISSTRVLKVQTANLRITVSVSVLANQRETNNASRKFL